MRRYSFNSSHSTLEVPVVNLLRKILGPIVIVTNLFVCIAIFGQQVDDKIISVAANVFLLALLTFDEMHFYLMFPHYPLLQATIDIMLKWSIIIACMLPIIFVTKTYNETFVNILISWIIITPSALVIVQVLARKLLKGSIAKRASRNAIIIGANQLGDELFHTLNNDPYLGIKVTCFFDDRTGERLPAKLHGIIQGGINDVPQYVRDYNINMVYICLPINPQPRISRLFDALRDTTASIYLVPDTILFDLIQSRIDIINGIPLISVCDTPFFGTRSLVKRGSDILIAILFLVLLAPVMGLIAAGIRLTSPGPALFKQRRYGLDGEEIKVYKFRTMSVMEDGDHVMQAKKDDQRITPFGRFLRKTSLDELPQLVNVLKGCMSIVGPRPHAVAHNELFRKVVKNYMIRYKVKPGITGWAQVNGFRGETNTVDKIKARVEYDIDYLRNWSIFLDFWIILKTFKVLLGDKHAF